MRYNLMRITFNRAGLKIRGHVFGKAPHPQDAVILSHGFMANERMCHKYAKLLAEMGFLTVTFDFCGGGIFSRSDGLSQDMTLFTEKAEAISWLPHLRLIRWVRQYASQLIIPRIRGRYIYNRRQQMLFLHFQQDGVTPVLH